MRPWKARYVAIAAGTLLGAWATLAHAEQPIDMDKVCYNLLVQYPASSMTVTSPGNYDWKCWDDGRGGPHLYAHMRDERTLRHWEQSSADDDGVEVNDASY